MKLYLFKQASLKLDVPRSSTPAIKRKYIKNVFCQVIVAS